MRTLPPVETPMGFQTLDEMATTFHIELKSPDKRLIANILNHLARRNGDEVESVRKRYRDANGAYQSYKVSAFDSKYGDVFEQLCLMLGYWN